VRDEQKILESLKFLIENKEEREKMSNNAFNSYQDLVKIDYLQKLKDSWKNLHS